MKISREEKKAEAIKRMKSMGIFPQTIEQFEKQDLVSVSEPPVGAFYWADEETKERIQKIEADCNGLIYLVIRSYTTIGMMDSFFYVSDHKNEWATDRQMLRHHETVAYVYNHDAPECSEFGYIEFERTEAAGLERTA